MFSQFTLLAIATLGFLAQSAQATAIHTREDVTREVNVGQLAILSWLNGN